jgi:alpha-tubulin suppressor-like RCC1 family protein
VLEACTFSVSLQVFTLGSGVRGALGRGPADLRPEVLRVTGGALAGGVPVVHVSAGDDFSAAVTLTGFGVAWGWNKHGQLGVLAAPTPSIAQGAGESKSSAAASKAQVPLQAPDAISAVSHVEFLPARVDLPELVQVRTGTAALEA